MASSPAPLQPLDLALQGGGSHGAFTWGVLDGLLDDETLEFSCISGTSAGALNAAVMATGLVAGGRPGPRDARRGVGPDVRRPGPRFRPLPPAPTRKPPTLPNPPRSPRSES